MTPALRQEWHQFRLLSRDSVRRLLDSVLVSRDADPMLFALWCLTLAMTPPMLVAMRKTIQYPFMLKAPPELVERVATADRTFFVLYGMLATALLAAMTWDALFPDRVDQEIVGALPVRPRTLASARLAAALTLGGVFAVAINLPAAVIYSAASSVHPLIGSFPRVLLAHVTATMMGCAFIFLTLMTVRAVVAICAGERIADRLALVLQFATIVLLVEVFLFLPAVMPDIIKAIQEGRSSLGWVPTIWFSALFVWMAEGGGFLAHYVVRALLGTAIVAMLVVVVSLLPAAWMGRRVLEVRTLERASRLTSLARAIAFQWVRGPVVRGIFVFGVASLVRSRRHTILLASYLGLAIAIGVLRLIPALVFQGGVYLDAPRAYTLALPLVLTVFAVFGLRAAFGIPTELDANWVFRLVQPTVQESVRASRWLILLLGVAPITIVWQLVAFALWPVREAFGSTMFVLVTGMLLTECALGNWTKVPFASAHAPATDTLRSKGFGYLAALVVGLLVFSSLQVALLRSWTGTVAYIGLGAALVILVRLWRAHTLRGRTPTFDVPSPGPVTLDLSEAL